MTAQRTFSGIARIAEQSGQGIRNSCYILRNPCYAGQQILLATTRQLTDNQELTKWRSIPKNIPIKEIPTLAFAFEVLLIPVSPSIRKMDEFGRRTKVDFALLSWPECRRKSVGSKPRRQVSSGWDLFWRAGLRIFQVHAPRERPRVRKFALNFVANHAHCVVTDGVPHRPTPEVIDLER